MRRDWLLGSTSTDIPRRGRPVRHSLSLAPRTKASLNIARSWACQASPTVEGRIKEVADYCETDAVNTYRIWLRYELFRGRLTELDYTTQARSASSSSSIGAWTRGCAQQMSASIRPHAVAHLARASLLRDDHAALLISWRMRRSASSQYEGFISIAIRKRPKRKADIAVLPEPRYPPSDIGDRIGAD